jgi:hypothetical protein
MIKTNMIAAILIAFSRHPANDRRREEAEENPDERT